MLENFKPVAFEPYGRKRSSWRLPSWLVLLVVGVGAGVGGVMVVQERFMPPRLSASEAATLTERLAQAEQDRDRARGDLAATTQRLDAVVAERKSLVDELAADRVWAFCTLILPLRDQGAAGSAVRPVAIGVPPIRAGRK